MSYWQTVDDCLSQFLSHSPPSAAVHQRPPSGHHGAGAGNAPTEVLAATFERLDIETGIDVAGVLAAAQDVLRPALPRLPVADRSAIVQGYAGVYSSFLLHAERAAERYDVPAHEILQRVGEAGYVGGQEDMIIDIAIQLAAEREAARGRAGHSEPVLT
jgi:4-hydroxy 2-oxovalerate aldolase